MFKLLLKTEKLVLMETVVRTEQIQNKYITYVKCVKVFNIINFYFTLQQYNNKIKYNYLF